MSQEPTRLGTFLKSSRNARGLTLRAVEEATGVSNAYLSQLESGKIQKPSPTILHKLSELYGASYSSVMEYAGHPVPGSAAPTVGRDRLASRLGPTTQDEEEALIEYLQFLRTRRDRIGGDRR